MYGCSGRNKCTTVLCILFSWLLKLCYGFVLLSSASGIGGGAVFASYTPGKTWLYDYQTTVLLNGKGDDGNDVGFFIIGQLSVESLWGDGENLRLLQLQLKSLQLHIRSRKAPSPDGFVFHSSQLDQVEAKPFFLLWNRGKIEKFLIDKDESIISVINLKKGAASLFQYQLSDQELNETDSSGSCLCNYQTESDVAIKKIKKDCLSSDLPYVTNPDLSTKTESYREIVYNFDRNNKKWFTSSNLKEIHTIAPSIKENIGNKVEIYQILTLKETGSVETLSGQNFNEILSKLTRKNRLKEESILIDREPIAIDEIKLFSQLTNEFRDKLKNDQLGSLNSAKIIPKLLKSARQSSREDIAKTLSSKKNKDILPQLYDILGYVQTFDSHEAAMKKLHFDDQKMEDLSERYLWALSISSQPNPDIIKNLLEKSKKSVKLSEKITETLLLTIASMAHRLSKLPPSDRNQKIQRQVEDYLLEGIDYAKGEEKLFYLKALKNLQSKASIPKLLEIINNSTDKEEVLAWKALRSFSSNHWDQSITINAINTLFQLDKKHDSSARTLAADILLESELNDNLLIDLINHLKSDCPAYEIKQYLLQKIRMKAEKDPDFSRRISSIIQNDKKLNNYYVLSQKGLSTAMSRGFFENPYTNGSLVTVQEMFAGIVKRGIVDIVLERNRSIQEIFSLGIFSKGLASFVSNEEESNDNNDQEPSTAGMELSILGTQIRPFVFFTGQGELMGHVWSGTASEKTTAFQALIQLHNHEEYLRLGPGFVAEFDLIGATSFDLSGKIEFSLWNRNAVSVVEKSAGILLEGLIRVDTSFVKSQVEFSVSMEPKLNLQIDTDFYSNVYLCMRLSQPPVVIRHNVYKTERIPGSKHRLRKVKYRKQDVPGRTYFLNKKNNEMCNAIFK